MRKLTRLGFVAIVSASIALLTAARDARAIVGPSNEHGSLEAHAVMIVSRGQAAGFCTGVVIGRDIVLTAAHCFRDLANTRVHYRDDGGGIVLREVAAAAIHPEFRPNAIALRQRSIDLALLRLVAPLPERLAPARLASDTVSVGERLRVAGFGLARESGASGAGVFRWGVIAARGPLSSILLWADDPARAGLGACAGDSGGPIFAGNDDRVVAITAWSTGGGKGHCGGLTQGALIAPQRGWIDRALAAWGAR